MIVDKGAGANAPRRLGCQFSGLLLQGLHARRSWHRRWNPNVLEINSMAALGSGASFVLAAKAAGYNFSQLVNRIVDVAHRRYFFPMQTPMHASGNIRKH